ncbi:MAG TPA: choice-of-anchor M domain-containing protein, partial [Ilumatobacter sp.]|nr:choice-of-anchor M domain-containing protein [Ilumatobacter sp.]
DAATQTVPDDPTYAFLGVEPGTDVHVVPQVQNPDVVWVGWNTQEPNVMAVIDRGVTLTLLGVQGPGSMTVYLQAGNLSAPDVLWQSTRAEAQPLWVEVNTHTHANWVFTEPGIYLVQVEASADLIDGQHVAAVSTLRFAVGDAASADEARQATFIQTVPATASTPTSTPAAATANDSDADDSGGGGAVIVVVVAVAVLLAAAVVAVVVRGGRAKRRAEEERIAARYRDGGQP